MTVMRNLNHHLSCVGVGAITDMDDGVHHQIINVKGKKKETG